MPETITYTQIQKALDKYDNKRSFVNVGMMTVLYDYWSASFYYQLKKWLHDHYKTQENGLDVVIDDDLESLIDLITSISGECFFRNKALEQLHKTIEQKILVRLVDSCSVPSI